MPHRLPSFTILIGIVLAGSSGAAEPDPKGVEYFEKHVRPLLIKRCYECHSAEEGEVKGGLALDSRAGWQQGGDSGPAIEPGSPTASLLIEAVRYESYEMPPAGRMPDEEIAILEKWVAMGAPDPREGGESVRPKEEGLDLAAAREFWAFQLPEPHTPPVVQNGGWCRDDIDRFILARLEAEGIEPNGDAAPAAWLRRVTFDLTGLPPTPEELNAFLADPSQEAREQVVDRLLASSQFGVHWGRHWLDVARYADSNGSDFNATFFNAWRYRNYVVDAFNRDEPFDQFVRKQVAGDLMDARTDKERIEQLVATTFLMLGPKMLSERDKEKLTMDVVDEQVDTVGKAFLGLTLGCARCHDHKFDPVPTDDYYALAGIMASTVTLEGESQQYVSTWVETPLPLSDEQARRIEQHNARQQDAEAKLKEAKAALKVAEAELTMTLAGEEGILVDDEEAVLKGHWKESKYSPNFVGVGYRHDERAEKGEKSVTWTPDVPKAGEYEVRLAFPGASGRDAAVPVTIQHADGETVVKVDQTKVASINELFEPLGVFRFEKGHGGSVTISTEGTTGYVIADAVQFVPQGETAGDGPEPEVLAAARDAVKKHKSTVEKLEKSLKELKAVAPEVPKAMAAREAPEVGDCQICIRGEVSKRGDEVPRGFLRVVGTGTSRVQQIDQSGRLELAEWLTRPDHPLTARVIVNRVWDHVMGFGLVRSVDNFGHLGERPSHPELLDTLAVEFVESGWSVKQLVRRLVLTRTYGLSSENRDGEVTEIDAENRLLWRAHRKRLTAESLRDAMLAASGQLDLSVGGSPVKGLGRLAINNSNQASSGRRTDSYRRSIYLPIIRNELPPFLTVFDFADPDVVTGHRPTTNVPAQALFLLNSDDVTSYAEATAERIAEEASHIDHQVSLAYEVVLNRDPSAEDFERAVNFLKRPADKVDEKLASRRLAELVQVLFASTEFRLLD